jgi:hypothetical protein
LFINILLVILLAIKKKNHRKRPEDKTVISEVIRKEIVKSILTGPKHPSDLVKEIWPKVAREGISKKSFQSVILKRRLEELEHQNNLRLIVKIKNEPRNVIYDITSDSEDSEKKQKAIERAIFYIYGSPEHLKDLSEFLKFETNEQPLIQAFSGTTLFFLLPFWMKLAQAIESGDDDSFTFYSDEGGKFLSLAFVAAAKLFKLDEYKEEVDLINEFSKTDFASSFLKEHGDAMHEAGKGIILRPERFDFWSKWLKEKVERERKFYRK